MFLLVRSTKLRTVFLIHNYIDINFTDEYLDLHTRFGVYSKIAPSRIMSYADRLNSTGVPVVIPLADEKPATVSRTYCA